MRPVVTEETDAVFRLPEGTHRNDLPVARAADGEGRAVLASVWELSPDERQAVAAGANIELAVWGTTLPPVGMGITALQAIDVVPDSAPEG